MNVELTRSKIVLDDKRVDVEAEPFGDGIIGKITLYSFYEGDNGLSSEKDLKKAIDDLRSQGTLYGLVLDMRENSGGFLSQAVKVSGLFISSGVVVISKYSDGTVKYYRAVDGNRYYDGPLAILISRGSASATEIVAQTLQDYGVAVVVVMNLLMEKERFSIKPSPVMPPTPFLKSRLAVITLLQENRLKSQV